METEECVGLKSKTMVNIIWGNCVRSSPRNEGRGGGSTQCQNL